MKYIAKMMLAALASVALAVPAYAWDWSASGSMSTTFNSTSTVTGTGASAVASGGFGSDAGAITLSSSHKSGDKSATLSYKLDWDGNLDEVWAASGSTKVGNWTASSSIDYNNANTGGQSGADTPALTLTDGSATIKMGSAGHLGSGRKASAGNVSGKVSMLGGGSGGYDYDIGAVVDSFQGVSYGASLSPTMSYTDAYGQQSSGSICGAIGDEDGLSSGYSATSFGANVAADVGAAIGFTFCSGSTASVYDNVSGSTSATTMGLGVQLDMGDMKPFFTYGSVSATGSETEATKAVTGTELGLTYALGGGDSVVFNYSMATHSDANNSAGETGMELEWGTKVGPASLSVGYGSTTITNADSVATAGAEGYAMTDIEVKMAYGW